MIYTVGVCVLGVVELGIVLQMVKVNYADKCGRVCVCACVQLCRVLAHVYVCPQLMTRHVLSAVKQLCNNGGIVYVQYELHPQAYAFIPQKYLIFIQCKHVVSPDMSMSLPSVD